MNLRITKVVSLALVWPFSMANVVIFKHDSSPLAEVFLTGF